MSQIESVPKVRSATVTPQPQGGSILKLHTVEGMEVEFLLDDAAFTLLAMTAQLSVSAVKNRVGDDPENLFMFERNDEE